MIKAKDEKRGRNIYMRPELLFFPLDDVLVTSVTNMNNDKYEVDCFGAEEEEIE